MAPNLFSMMFSAMLTDAFHDSDIGITLWYQFDGEFFNHLRLQAKTKVQTDTMCDLVFVDGCTFSASTQFKL